MSNLYITTEVNRDGTITIPAIAARGMGYSEPGEPVGIAIPLQQCICDCEESELFISRCCGAAECEGYTSHGGELNIPSKLFSEASVPIGTSVTVLAADGALVIVAAGESLEDLPAELRCFLCELGLSPYFIRIEEGGGE